MKKRTLDTPRDGKSWAETQATKAYKLPAPDDVPAIFPGSRYRIVVDTVKWEDRKWFNC
jgi:hypothetical protein